MLYFVINVSRTAIWNFLDSAWVEYYPERSRCDLFVDVHRPNSKAALYVLDAINDIFYTAPAFAVAISCSMESAIFH